MRLIILLAILFCISCNQKNSEEQKSTDIKTESKNEENDDQDIENAKTWLVQNIEKYFTDFNTLNGDYSSITTKEYAEFKSDATGVGMDGGMDESAFKTKWAKRNTEKAGLGEGFMIGGNDFGKIKVTKAEFKNKTESGDYMFETLIEDTEFKSKFYRDIVVKKTGNSFLIDDVIESKNEFK